MSSGSPDTLTEMQRQCLRLVILHFSSKDIARELNLSPHTVDNHVKAAMQKLGAVSRFEAARIYAAHDVTQNANDERRSLTSQRSALAKPSTDDPSTPSPDDRLSDLVNGGSSYQGKPVVAFPAYPNDPRRQRLLPLPRVWGEENKLSVGQRLFWIAALTAMICLSIGAVLASLRALHELV
jgi:DNA-binding CsgD family transcriptional regulator